jgi:exonuclease VII small subunit
MSETAHASIQPPQAPISSKFAEAYAELQAIAERLKPNAAKVPDVDEIEPLVARAQELASHCEERIAAVKRMLDQGVTSRFAQNRTLSGKSQQIRAFRKRRCADDWSPSRRIWRLPLQNPLSTSARKAIPSCMCPCRAVLSNR